MLRQLRKFVFNSHSTQLIPLNVPDVFGDQRREGPSCKMTACSHQGLCLSLVVERKTEVRNWKLGLNYRDNTEGTEQDFQNTTVAI